MEQLKSLILIHLIWICAIPSFGQDNADLRTITDSYMQDVREKNYTPSLDYEILNPANAEQMLSIIQPYLNDTLAKVRLKANYIHFKIGKKSADLLIRQATTNKLILACNDFDSGNVGSCLSWLSNFQQEDFSDPSKDSITTLLRKPLAHYDKLLKLVGFLNLENEKDFIREQISQGSLKSNSDKWAAYLALARMGDQDAISTVMGKVNNLQVNDNLVYDILPDLIYTRSKEAFDFMVEILNSQSKNCSAANPETTTKIECGYRVMEYLAPVIRNFPLETDKWGDLEVDDYELALQQVREWFKNNMDYDIISNTF